ncbi:MAG TPA: hypothetical protein VHX38_41265 [Pseudonocardiaceae bacterium]|jgi:hypothetical protein|nr:hypothetical protein [Pseudonocardiaceae bacterium]
MATQKKKNTRHEERRFTVRGIRRTPPDLGKLSRALIGLAQAEAEREAAAEHTAREEQPEDTPADKTQSGGSRNV